MTFEDMLPLVLPSLPGCPTPHALNKLRDAAIEFCTDTVALTAWIDETSNASGQVEPVAEGNDEQIISVIGAQVDGEDIEVIEENDPDASERTDETRAIVSTEPTLVTIVPTPSASLAVRLFVARVPTQDATEIPDWLGSRYREVIADGALGRLFEEPGKTWTNERSAAFHWGRFKSRKDDIAAFIGSKRLSRPLRVKPA